VSLLSSGVCTIQATQPGNANYTAALPVSQSFEVTFQGLGTNVLLLGSAAGSSSVVLSYSGAWAATANAPFLHIAPGSNSGNGNGVVVFTYDAFTSAGVRTGSLTIAGYSILVTQAGTNYAGPGPLTTLVPSGVNEAAGVAVDNRGNLYFLDASNSLNEWNTSTQQVSILGPSGLGNPVGVTVDSRGNVYMADSGGTINEWGASTQQVTALVIADPGTQAIAVDRSGNIYVSGVSGAIKQWNPVTQQFATVVASGCGPGGLAVDSSGDVYFLDASSSLFEWNSSTLQVTMLAPSGITNPVGTAVAGSGSVYMAGVDGMLNEWRASTQQVTALGSSGLRPNGIAVDGLGDIYLADASKTIKQILRVFVSSDSFTEPPTAGADSLPSVLPSTTSLVGAFAPTSDQSWLTIGSIANGVVNFSFTANPSNFPRTARITELGQQIIVTQSPGGPPTVGSLTPNSGTGITQTFTMSYSDPFGASDLSSVLVLFNSSLNMSGGCVISYTPANNKLHLYNDAGTGLSPGVTPGSVGSASNSQCTLAGTGSSFGTSGNVLTLNVALTFSGTFIGSKNVYLSGLGQTASSGWVQKGTWLPVSAGPPTVVSLSPSSGTNLAQTFVMVYSDPNGASDLSSVLVLMNNSVNLNGGCAVVYWPSTNKLFLYNDAGTALSTGLIPGSSGTVSNTQCTLAAAGSSVATSGNNLTLTITLTSSGTFVGSKNVYLNANGRASSSGWVLEGSWIP
jgi:streptogramin lyase